jgi:hypothetical protein
MICCVPLTMHDRNKAFTERVECITRSAQAMQAEVRQMQGLSLLLLSCNAAACAPPPALLLRCRDQRLAFANLEAYSFW